MKTHSLRQSADRVRAVPLQAVLNRSGAHPDPRDPTKWHTSQGTLSVNGPKFMNWTLGHGGGGAIDLAMHLHNLDFLGAVRWLCAQAPQIEYHPQHDLSRPRQLQMPTPDPRRLPRVQHYLVSRRCLPPDLLRRLIADSSLYADHRANAVFVLRDHLAQPVGAELRGTGSQPWRGMAPGSRKHLGCFAVGSPQATTWVLCESAIDAISCAALHPGYRCLSTAGLNANPLWLPALICPARRIFCGFDADPPGEAAAHHLLSRFPHLQRFRPAGHDWNEQLQRSL